MGPRGEAESVKPGAVSTPRSDLSALVELTESLARRHDIHDILFFVVSRLAELLEVDRGSIVLLDDRGTEGLVVATSDDEEIRGLDIDLEKYPELREVVRSGRPLLIDDVRNSSLLTDVLAERGPLEFSSMALIPIIGEAGAIAVLVLKGRARQSFSAHELEKARTVANATAIALNNAKLLGALRAQSRRERAERQRRLAALSRYFDVFESSADAMLVMQSDGTILFANPSLLTLVGGESKDIVGRHFSSLFPSQALDRAGQIVRRFADGEFPVLVDFPIQNPSGLTRIVSISFSEIASENDAVLASMRDVTRERELARELARTKEFLERVIESSVDGIVSADLKGNILLYNRAAAKLFGYAKRDVLGRLNVEQLYPPGIARQIMRLVRGPDHGGSGRLEGYQVTMVDRDGAPIPTTLSASLVMDGARPIATLGIFTDIREKLAMERRLELAQKELREHEKASAVAALAGAAAHELNQPLTSIMGYTEVLSRALLADPVLGRATQVIQSEADRMAEIIRKVGAVTRVATKEYVGSAQIIDLELSSDES